MLTETPTSAAKDGVVIAAEASTANIRKRFISLTIQIKNNYVVGSIKKLLVTIEIENTWLILLEADISKFLMFSLKLSQSKIILLDVAWILITVDTKNSEILRELRVT